jgi:hypothetical protein
MKAPYCKFCESPHYSHQEHVYKADVVEAAEKRLAERKEPVSRSATAVVNELRQEVVSAPKVRKKAPIPRAPKKRKLVSQGDLEARFSGGYLRLWCARCAVCGHVWLPKGVKSEDDAGAPIARCAKCKSRRWKGE